ncbi:swi5-like zinc finger protein [Coemansia sp. RSA 522]|nr:swi5-like zinc finger protein [Coemansia sp. RSA 522]
MDATPSKRKQSSNVPSLVLESDNTSGTLFESHTDRKPRLFEPRKDRKHELRTAIATATSELDVQRARRDALEQESGLTVERARQLNDENIDRLHRYNDTKDAAQILFGKLAELKGKTIKEIYAEYDIDLDD